MSRVTCAIPRASRMTGRVSTQSGLALHGPFLNASGSRSGMPYFRRPTTIGSSSNGNDSRSGANPGTWTT